MRIETVLAGDRMIVFVRGVYGSGHWISERLLYSRQSRSSPRSCL